jgi:restriction system protein
MAVPGFQEITLPLLQLLNDGQEHRTGDAISKLGQQLALTPADLEERLPSGVQTRFANRVYWSFVHLSNSALIERVAQGRYRITPSGQAALAAGPSRIDMRFLLQYPSYQAFRRASQSGDEQEVVTAPQGQTPDEVIQSAYLALRRTVEAELLERVKQASPAFFEQLVVKLLVAMGYGGSQEDAGQAVGRSGDGGIDGVVNEDKLGLDVVYIQAKRWEANVGSPVLQGFVGSLEAKRAHKGVLIRTSGFTSDARDFVRAVGKRIVLIDGTTLAHLMYEHGVGVVTVDRFDVKKVAAGFFDDELATAGT